MWDSNVYGDRPSKPVRIDRDAEVARYVDPWAKCWFIDELDDGRGYGAMREELSEGHVTIRKGWLVNGRGHGYPTRPLGVLIEGPEGVAIGWVPGADPRYQIPEE